MLTPLTFVGNDADMIEAIRAGHSGAAACLYDRYARQVWSMLVTTLGPDDDFPDLLHDVFIVALDNLDQLRDVDRLGNWLSSIAIFVARAQIRRRTRRKWLRFFSPEQTRTWEIEQPSTDARRALLDAYVILERMSAEPRMAFVLRYVHGMTLPSAAKMCGTSLSTFKRRLQRATEEFLEVARTRPRLVQFMHDGTRWSPQSRD